MVLGGGVRVVLGLVGPVGCPWWGQLFLLFMWWCFTSEGPPPPLVFGRVFSFDFNSFGIGRVSLLSQKN